MGFIEDIAPLVQKHIGEYGIKVVSPILAQAILESASGTSSKAKHHNYFGLKYRENRITANSGYFYDGGSEQNKDGSYKPLSNETKWFNFLNMEQGVIGYLQFINTSNYANLKGITDPRRYLELIKQDKYATSIDYVDKVMNIVDKYGLRKYDNVIEYYRVQCGAYKFKANALVLQLRLKLKGYKVIIKQIDGLYKCQMGAYSKESNAKIMLDKLKKDGFNCFITYN